MHNSYFLYNVYSKGGIIIELYCRRFYLLLDISDEAILNFNLMILLREVIEDNFIV